MAHAWTSSSPSLTIPETTNVKFRGEVWTVFILQTKITKIPYRDIDKINYRFIK